MSKFNSSRNVVFKLSQFLFEICLILQIVTTGQTHLNTNYGKKIFGNIFVPISLSRVLMPKNQEIKREKSFFGEFTKKILIDIKFRAKNVKISCFGSYHCV